MTAVSLRVAMVTRAIGSLHGPGGLERHVDDLVRHLLARGVSITLVTRPASSVAAPAARPETLRHPRLTVHPVAYYTFPGAGRRGTTILDRSTAYPWFGWRAGRVAARLADRDRLDLVHGHGAAVFGFGSTGGSADRRVPLVFNPHGLEEFGSTDPSRAPLKRLAYRPLQAVVRSCASAADRIIATDHSLVPSVLTHLRIPEQMIRVVPNAVDIDNCDRLAGPDDGALTRSNLGLRPDDTLILSVGRIEGNKGFDVLARALAALDAGSVNGARTAMRSRWHWVVIGDGSFRPGLARLVDDLGLHSRTTMPGRVSETALHGWYEAATLFVHPTLYEGSSLVTLEAMAHSRPVVATTAGGLPDKVQPGVSGWLVQPGNAPALATALTEALSQRERFVTMGRAARSIVERQFSWTAATDRLLEVYDEVLSGRR